MTTPKSREIASIVPPDMTFIADCWSCRFISIIEFNQCRLIRLQNRQIL